MPTCTSIDFAKKPKSCTQKPTLFEVFCKFSLNNDTSHTGQIYRGTDFTHLLNNISMVLPFFLNQLFENDIVQK